ncbi:MAG: alcohol dehydrogenase catalytic domain-containing protein [Cyanobacteria bacterium]|nr:alcohol dehydrogenase catalytic domain-containing protein [Cyanobacteriota bacterium]
MLAAQIESNYTFGLTDIPEPSLLPGGAILKMTGCGLCGSDLDKLINHKSLPGSILGHEVTGILLEIDSQLMEGTEKLHTFQPGDRVVTSHHVPCQHCHYCLNNSPSMCREFKSTHLSPGGFAQKIGLSLGHLNHTCFKIPPHITDAEASCVEPLGCVLRAVDKSSPFTFGSVAVVGLGFIGMLAAQAYRNKGFQVYGVDILENRLILAQEHQFVNKAFHPLRDSVWAETGSRRGPIGSVHQRTREHLYHRPQSFVFQRDYSSSQLFPFPSVP